MQDIETGYKKEEQKGNFFIKAKDLSPIRKKPRLEHSEKNAEQVKQLRWDGREFYIVSHTIPRPAVRENWEKQDGRDLKISVKNFTETQVFWAVERSKERLPELPEEVNPFPEEVYGNLFSSLRDLFPRYKYGPGISI